MATSLKLQVVHGSSPRLHEWDQRGELFAGDAQGDSHATIFEVDPLVGTVGEFMNRLTGRGAQFILPLVTGFVDNPEESVIQFIENHGSRINDSLKNVAFQGNSLRIALMSGAEE